MGGVNQQYKRQLQSEVEVKKGAEGQGWSKCQHTEEMVPLQSRDQKGHSISFQLKKLSLLWPLPTAPAPTCSREAAGPSLWSEPRRQ